MKLFTVLLLLLTVILGSVDAKCCKRCATTQRACGDQCIASGKTCSKDHGCACHAKSSCGNVCKGKGNKPCGNGEP